MKQIQKARRKVLVPVLAAAAAFMPGAAADDAGVQITREPFIELSWESVNASRYEVRAGARRLMSAARLSYLHTAGPLPENLSVEAVRFEGDGVDEEFREVRESVRFDAQTRERYVIDWDPDIHDRPYLGVSAGYEGPVSERGIQIHFALQRPFIVAPPPGSVVQLVFGNAVENSDGSRSAPFEIGPDGFVGLAPYIELELP